MKLKEEDEKLEEVEGFRADEAVTWRWLKLKRSLFELAVTELGGDKTKREEYAYLDKIGERFERALRPSTKYIMGPKYGPLMQGRAKIHWKRMKGAKKVEPKLEGVWAEPQETEEDEDDS